MGPPAWEGALAASPVSPHFHKAHAQAPLYCLKGLGTWGAPGDGGEALPRVPECSMHAQGKAVSTPSTPDPRLLVCLVTDGTSKGESWAERQRHRGRIRPIHRLGCCGSRGTPRRGPSRGFSLRLFIQNWPQPQSRVAEDVASPPVQAGTLGGCPGSPPRSQQWDSPAMSAKPPRLGQHPPGTARQPTPSP